MRERVYHISPFPHRRCIIWRAAWTCLRHWQLSGGILDKAERAVRRALYTRFSDPKWVYKTFLKIHLAVVLPNGYTTSVEFTQ